MTEEEQMQQDVEEILEEGTATASETTPDWEAERDTLIKERDEYLDQWKRSAAEFINFKKREERMRAERDRSANQRLLSRLLPIMDDFKRGLQHRPEELVENDWANGLMAIERKLWLVLEQEGVSEIEAQPGTPFDPTVHDAITAQEQEGIESGHIIAELERGYKHGDFVLRPARVVVAK